MSFSKGSNRRSVTIDESSQLLHDNVSIGSSDTNTSDEELSNKRWKYQALALICTLLLSIGSHYSGHCLSALKPTLKKEMHITDLQYGILQSTVALVNTVLPLLAGVYLDFYGTISGSIFSTTCILVGSIIVAAATNFQSFYTMVVGRIVYGLGSGTVAIVQETIIAKWFRGKGLAVALGVNIAVSRCASFLGVATIIPISKFHDFYGFAFWFAALLCLISWVFNLIYAGIASKSELAPTTHNQADPRRKVFKWDTTFRFSTQFWIFMVVAVTMMAGWNTFLHINTEIIKLRFDYTDELAAWRASVAQILPIFAPPILGQYIDRIGQRPLILIISVTFYLISMIMVGFTDINPFISMTTFSLSMATGVVPTLSSLPLLLPQHAVGTGYGLYKTVWSIGSVIDDIVTGLLQKKQLDKHSYDVSMAFMVATASIALVAAFIIFINDKFNWGGYLSLPTEDRLNKFGSADGLERYNHPKIQEMETLNPLPWTRYVPVVIFLTVFLISWIMFISFFLS